MDYKEADYLQLSGLQHFKFCRRQWALIHIENQWAENGRTADGAIMHESEIKELAKIPSKEVLIGKILGSIQSSLYGLAYVLQAKIDKEGGAEAAE